MRGMESWRVLQYQCDHWSCKSDPLFPNYHLLCCCCYLHTVSLVVEQTEVVNQGHTAALLFVSLPLFPLQVSLQALFQASSQQSTNQTVFYIQFLMKQTILIYPRLNCSWLHTENGYFLLPKGSWKTCKGFPITDVWFNFSTHSFACFTSSNTILASPKCLFVSGW